MPYGPRDPQRYPPHMNRRPFNGGDHNMNRQDMGMPPTDDFRGDFFPTGSFEAWGDNRRRFQDSGPHNRFPRREPFAGNARHGGDNSAWPTFWRKIKLILFKSQSFMQKFIIIWIYTQFIWCPTQILKKMKTAQKVIELNCIISDRKSQVCVWIFPPCQQGRRKWEYRCTHTHDRLIW